jgi:hypothetical protein
VNCRGNGELETEGRQQEEKELAAQEERQRQSEGVK